MSINSISRKATKILRHKLNTIKHDEEGYVLVNSLIRKIPELTIPMMVEIVENDIKNRFDLKNINQNYYVRANQGHSSGNLNDDKMLEVLHEPIIGCYHGTYTDKLGLIMKNGLSKMSRKHIHISESDDAISGKRASANIKVYIDMEKALIDGIKFYRSSNGVILTPGNDLGILEPNYFLKIEHL